MTTGNGPSISRLCQHRRAEDDARCVVNAHPGRPNLHAYIERVDPRLYLLDDLADTFRTSKEWPAYHHVRAVAHDLGFHLSSCVHGLRAVPYAPARKDRPTSADAS